MVFRAESSVTVIVPTFNSEKFLKKCLLSIRNQTYKNVEVIVIDNNSTDKTREIASGYCKTISFIGSRSAARNKGASCARGDFILSIDSDMELKSNVIDDCLAQVENGFAAVIIPEISVGEGFWAKCRALEKSCYIGDDLVETPRFFRKNVIETIGGYDSLLEAGEDWDLCERIKSKGFRIGRINSFLLHNEGKLSLRNAFSKKHYYGKTIRLYQKKHPVKARKQLIIIRPCFIKKWRLLANQPVNALGLFFLKTCEFAAGWLGSINGNSQTIYPEN